MAALVHLKNAEQFSAVIEASKQKNKSDSTQACLLRSPHFVMHAAALPEFQTLQSEPMAALPSAAQACAVGVIIPKRWSKRAVTRNTLKRQFYALAQTYAQALRKHWPGCALVLRQTATFDRKKFVSASSSQLKAAARQEMEQLFARLFATLPAEKLVEVRV